MEKGFTLIELIVSIAIAASLSLIVMFSTSQYINIGKDSNVQGNLAILVPAGESYYNIQNETYGDGYNGFCDSTAVVNIFGQLSLPNQPAVCSSDIEYAGLCCNVALDNNSWAACAQKFADPALAFCVDSRGVKKDIVLSLCTNSLYQCP